eukprot:3894775-Pleurochrysis_carterae.AAC.1
MEQGRGHDEIHCLLQELYLNQQIRLLPHSTGRRSPHPTHLAGRRKTCFLMDGRKPHRSPRSCNRCNELNLHHGSLLAPRNLACASLPRPHTALAPRRPSYWPHPEGERNGGTKRGR